MSGGDLREVWGVEAQTPYRLSRANPGSRIYVGLSCPVLHWKLKLGGRGVAIAIPLGEVKFTLACPSERESGGIFPPDSLRALNFLEININ